MSRFLAMLSVILLDSILLLTSAGAQCTILSTAANACPHLLPDGNCVASLEWFQKNEVACKGKQYPGIILKDKKQLKVTGKVPFKVQFDKFKEYEMSAGKCDDQKIIAQPPHPPFLADPNALLAAKTHILTAEARPQEFFLLNGGVTVDPHIIIATGGD